MFRDLRALTWPQRLVVGIGLIGACGYLLGSDLVMGLAKLTVASPLPLVFTERAGMGEDFASAFHVSLTLADGTTRAADVSPEEFRKIKGPYDRVGVYAGVFAFMPLIPERQWHAVMAYAYCTPGTLVDGLDGMTGRPKVRAVTIDQHTLTKGRTRHWQRVHAC